MEHTKETQLLFLPKKSKNESPTVATTGNTARPLFAIDSSYFVDSKQIELEKIGQLNISDDVKKVLTSSKWTKVFEGSFVSDDYSSDLHHFLLTPNPVLLVANCIKDIDNSPVIFALFSPTGFKAESEGISYTENSSSSFFCIIDGESTVLFRSSVQSNPRCYEFNEKNKQLKAIFAYHKDKKAMIFPLERELCRHNELDVLWPSDCAWPKEPYQDDLRFESFELFVLESNQMAINNLRAMSFYYEKINQPLVADNLISSASSVFSALPVFCIPSGVTPRILQVIINANLISDRMDTPLASFSEELVVLGCSKPIFAIQLHQLEGNYTPMRPLFNYFVLKGGLSFLLNSMLSGNIEAFISSKSDSSQLRQTLARILQMEKFEGLFEALAASKEFYELLLALLTQTPPSDRSWSQVSTSLNALVVVKLKHLLDAGGNEVWTCANRLNVLGLTLDFLAELSGEPRRRKASFCHAHETAAENQSSNTIVRDTAKRKGVGYDKENSGQSWIVSDYLANIKRKNESMVAVIGLIRIILDRDSFALCEQLSESCVLPLLENSFKNNSLHDISKESDLYLSFYELTLVIAKHKAFRHLLTSISAEYTPRPSQTIVEALTQQQASMLTFKGFVESHTSEKTSLVDLADKIIYLSDEIGKLCAHEAHGSSVREKAHDISTIEKLDLNERYKLALEKLRFGLTEMRKGAKYLHYYADSLEENITTSPAARSLRLAQEVTILITSLPPDSYNAIFARCDVARLDLMKAVIAGAEETPYAHGLFEYHILLPAGYPFVPPKCTFLTTGGGDVRFNPNLYNCGKVCLSLLGTWRGHASENWDSKISNILQLLLSLQSIVMSEEVYFNEPGFEHEVGTEGGESKNEAYSNIVRLCNIKYAMISQMRSPPSGFEHVVRRHFFIKRDVILRDCTAWVSRSENFKANYTELVLDHNHSYAMRFNNDPAAYLRELKAEIGNLERAFRELFLDTDPRDIYLPIVAEAFSHTESTPAPRPLSSAVINATEEVDVSYDVDVREESFDVDAGKVADRWSRYIGVLGVDAVRKQSNTSVLIVGMSAVGLEIAKNLALSGFKQILIADWQVITPADIPSLFYADRSQMGVNRATAVLSKLRQLNSFVRIEAKELHTGEGWEFINHFDAIVLCHHFPPVTDELLSIARSLAKKIVIAEVYGVFTRLFCDFGSEFLVEDTDGEQPIEVLFESIDYGRNVFLLAPQSQHNFKVDDAIQIFTSMNSEILHSCDTKNSIRMKVKEPINHRELGVEQNLKDSQIDTSRGKIRELKTPIVLNFRPFSNENENFIDLSINPCDFTKPNSPSEVALCFRFKQTFETRYSIPFSSPSFNNFDEHLSRFSREQKDELLQTFVLLGAGCAPSLAAFMGGLAAQEVIKAVTRKYRPLTQSFYYDCREIISSTITNLTRQQFHEKHQELHGYMKENSDKYLGELIGEDLLERLRDSNAFVIGAGAIGCELLKNLAQWGIGSGQGRLTVADPDSIELSNLSRQFLYREKHISKLKALVAARAVEALHPIYPPSHIEAVPLRVGPQSEDTFSDSFFARQALCLNALDNIAARLYVDQRCVQNSVPLLESGTLGPKGHVQVIVPFITENYSAVRDPQEETSIPVCTMKMFPEDVNHCIEWAKDKMDGIFFQKPCSLHRVIEEGMRGELASLELKLLRQSLRFLRRRPHNCRDCVQQARALFEKLFSNNLKQLLSVYPADSRGKDGRLFWELPRRLPKPITFDSKDSSHISAIKSTSKLLARVWSIDPIGFNNIDFITAANEAFVKPFATKDSAAKAMRLMLQNENGDKVDVEPGEDIIISKISYVEEWKAVLASQVSASILASLKEEVFEKDDDTNGHIDFIAAFTNLRASNYSLPQTDWITIKIRAGKITPALPTTTSVVAALQTIEAIKVIKGGSIEIYRNSFLNLAVPFFAMSEPGPATQYSLNPDLRVSLWDRWCYTFTSHSGDRLGDLFNWVDKTYHLRAVALMRAAEAVFMPTLKDWKEFENKKLSELLGLSENEFTDTQLICSLGDVEEPLNHIPPLRIKFESQ